MASMLGFAKKSPEHARAINQVAEWTRARFKLPAEAAIFVSEVACALPGCPPLETVVAFWPSSEKRHHFKLFKPVAEVVEDDLPPTWLKNSLAADDEANCDCC